MDGEADGFEVALEGTVLAPTVTRLRLPNAVADETNHDDDRRDDDAMVAGVAMME